MGQTPWAAVLNLSNSIIGVSVLAMPWCFRECGILLAIVLLLMTGLVNKFSCALLLRSSKAARKNSYESLANHTLGGVGKLIVEISLILLLIATCIAFFVIIGDLGPSLLSKFTGLENSWNLRTGVLLGVAVFIILPLTQKRNIESLSGLSTLSMCFYAFLGTVVLVDSLPKLFALDWVNDVVFWRPGGILKAMSIFALSLCCQPCVFPVYNSLLERTPKQMEDVTSKGINVVAGVYMVIGFFGYITYYPDGIKGDILLNQPPSLLADLLKLFFTLSVAIGFPLMVFPCRASIFSLLFPGQAESNPIGGMQYIPPTMFRIITLAIVTVALTIAIVTPHVEVVLSLTGATMGSIACFIMPAVIYQHTVGVPTRFMPKVLLIFGLGFMLISTYDNIHFTPVEDHIPAPKVVDKNDKIKVDEVAVNDVHKIAEKPNIDIDKPAGNMGLQGDDVLRKGDAEKKVEGVEQKMDEDGEKPKEDQGEVEGRDDKRQEPPIPHAPVDNPKPDNEIEVEDILKEVEKEKEEKEEPRRDVEEEREDLQEEKEKRDEAGAQEPDVAKKESKEAVEEAEEKLKVQEQKQEEQEKKLEELQARQQVQEELIIKQAEELQQLKKEHAEEKVKDEEIQKAAVQLAEAKVAQAQAEVAQVQAQAQAQQPLVQQPLGQPHGQQPLVQQPLVQQPAMAQQIPVQGQPLQGQVQAQLPLGQQAPQGQPLQGQPLVMQGQAAQGAVVDMQQQPVGQGQVIGGQQVLAGGNLAPVQPVLQGGGQPILDGGQGLGQLAVQGQQQLQRLQGQLGVQGQVGVQHGAGPRMASMGPGPGVMGGGAGGGGLGQGLSKLANVDQVLQVGVGQQGFGLEGAGMQVGEDGAMGQANMHPQQQIQGNVAQQVPIALQQQQLPVGQQLPLVQQQQPLPGQQQEVPFVPQGGANQPAAVVVNQQQNLPQQQPLDAGMGLVGNQQQQQGVVADIGGIKLEKTNLGLGDVPQERQQHEVS